MNTRPIKTVFNWWLAWVLACGASDDERKLLAGEEK